MSLPTSNKDHDPHQGSPLPWYRSATLWLMAALFALLVFGCVHLILVSLPVSAVDGDRPRGQGTVLGVPMTHQSIPEPPREHSPPNTEHED